MTAHNPIRAPRVIFLDVDGVLNRCGERFLYTCPAPRMKGPWVVDLNIVETVNYVLAQTDIKIVVSSTWRLPPVRDAADWCERTRVSPLLIHDDWRTVHLPPSPRALEINEWLSHHPETEAFMVIDDGADAGALFPDRFVQTDPGVGLTYDQFEVVLRKLGYTLQGSHKVQSRASWTAPKLRTTAVSGRPQP